MKPHHYQVAADDNSTGSDRSIPLKQRSTVGARAKDCSIYLQRASKALLRGGGKRAELT